MKKCSLYREVGSQRSWLGGDSEGWQKRKAPVLSGGDCGEGERLATESRFRSRRPRLPGRGYQRRRNNKEGIFF